MLKINDHQHLICNLNMHANLKSKKKICRVEHTDTHTHTQTHTHTDTHTHRHTHTLSFIYIDLNILAKQYRYI